MTKEMVVSANRHETKVAVLEDDQLVEIYFQRSNEYSLVGSIHKGRVTRVLPGMQSAFVELGLERDAFLYVSDFVEQAGEDYERVTAVDERPRRSENRPAPPPPPATPPPPAEEVPEAAAPEADAPAVAALEGAAPRESRDPNRENGRDGRRGRRSRRRRRGGRGFPESKYSSAEETQTGNPAEPIEAAEEPSEEYLAASEELDALILPGESIAKYQRREDEEESESGSVAEAEDAEVPAVAAAIEEESAAAPPAVEEDEDDLQAEVDELVAEAAAEQAAEIAQEAAEAALTDVAEAGEVPDADEDEPAVEAEPEMEALSGEGEGENGEFEAAVAGDGQEAAPEEGAVLEAGVREQTPARYIQRGPRRARRRGGRPERGDRPERGEQAPRGEQQPALRAEQQIAARPERESGGRREQGRDRDRDRPPLPSISDLLKEGQEVIVQIYKEPLGTKGARITSHIAMPGRYVVFMPTLDHLGVSRKVGTDDERHRLKKILQNQAAGMTGGFIVRTAAEGRTEAEIGADMSYLYNQWLDIRKRAEKRAAPLLLHHDLELVTRTLRDQANEQFKAIWVDNEDIYEKVVGFLERFQPALMNRVKLYSRDTPIFDTFNITAELEKALRPKVWLKSGGYIVINQTEALVAIDINTGKYVGKSNRLEDTIVKTNLEAIKEIVRQIRLRDLGGIIVVDFIDMEERRNRQKVMQALEEAMRVDRAPYKILSFNDFGLVAITRRRQKQSLERALCQACPTCEGAGYVKSAQTVIGEILTEAHKIRAAVEGKDVMLRVHPDVGREIKAAGVNYVAELEEVLGRPLIIKSDPELHPEKFDLA
jgi:ribonuclease G